MAYKDTYKEGREEYYRKYKSIPENAEKIKKWQKTANTNIRSKEGYRKLQNEYQARRNRIIRFEAIDMLGNKCCKCGFSDWRALQFDHIDGGGYKDRKENKTGSTNRLILRRLKSGNHNYQLLCANCNWIKRYENNEVPNKFEKEKKGKQ